MSQQPPSEKDAQKICDPKNLDKKLSRDDLIRNLKKISTCLNHIEQAKQFKNDKLAMALVGANLLKHRSKEVKLLTACCLADILRIYAPNAPYSEKEMKQVFELFFEQLRGLSATSSPNFARVYFILESFQSVHTPLVLVEQRMDDLVISLFRLFFEVVGEEVPPKLVVLMEGILTNIVLEFEDIPTSLLLTILVHTVPPRKEKNKAAYTLAHKIINKCEQELEQPISAFVDHIILKGHESEEDSDVYYEVLLDDRAAQLELVYELCVHSPGVLLSLSSDMQDLLEVEEVEERREWRREGRSNPRALTRNARAATRCM